MNYKLLSQSQANKVENLFYVKINLMRALFSLNICLMLNTFFSYSECSKKEIIETFYNR